MIDPSLVKGMPDDALASAATKGDGAVPSWLAAAELQSRNNLRKSAPVAAPQQTVIQGLVGDALRSSGIMGQSRQPQPQPMAPSAPQGQSGPTGMAKGGIVKMASGDMVPKSADVSYNPVTYNPAISPDALTLEQASRKTAPLYGKGPDFDTTLKNIQGLKAPMPNQGLGSWLTNLVGGALSDTKGNAVNAFGEGLQNAEKLSREGAQQGFANKLAQQKEALGVQEQQATRQEKIADAAQRYHALNATIADNQAREQAEVAKGNSQGALQVQEYRQRAEQARAEAARDVAKEMGNPLTVAAALGKAKADGNAADTQLYSDALKSIQGQQQATSDIEQKRQQALQKDMASRQMSVEAMKLSGERTNKLMELNANRSLMGLPAISVDKQGNIVQPQEPAQSGPKGPNGENLGPPAKTAPDQPSPTTAHGIDSAHGNEYDQPPDRLSTAALNWIKTENTGIGMRGGNAAFQFNLGAQGKAQELMKNLGIKADDLGGIRAAYKGANTEYNKISGIMGPINSAEQTINLQLPNLVAMAHKLKSANANLNSGPDAIKKVLGNNGYVAYNLALSTLPDEYAVVLSKGNPTEGIRDEQRKNFSQSLSAGGIDSLAKQVQFETEQRVQGYHDEMANAKYRMGIKPLVDFAKKGTWDSDPGVKEREGLPEGQGKKLTDKTVADSFVKAAANKIGNADLSSPEVKNEARKLARVKGWEFGK